MISPGVFERSGLRGAERKRVEPRTLRLRPDSIRTEKAPTAKRASRNVGARVGLLVRRQRVEIDAVGFVGLNTVLQRIAAMNMHQGLHAAGIQMVDMLMA